MTQIQQEEKKKKKEMKVTWKNQNNNKKKRSLVSLYPTLSFNQNNDDDENPLTETSNKNDVKTTQLADSFQSQGDHFAQDGRYREALGKWETALNLKPERAVLHEQKAQILLEIGEAWKALKAATRATELEPEWAEAWITLGRAQLNFGEPDSAAESFDRALAIKPDLVEARDDKQTALNLAKKRKQLVSSGLSSVENRYVVGDKAENT